MIHVERMSLALALDLAARIADPGDGADEVPHGDRREAVDVLRCEVVRLRTIIEGRTVPPTEAEIAAHHRAGGTWYVASTHGRALTTTRADAVALCAHLAASKYPATWWAISVRGRPCAWPVVAEVSR